MRLTSYHIVRRHLALHEGVSQPPAVYVEDAGLVWELVQLRHIAA